MINYKEKFEEVLKMVYESEDYAHLINEVRYFEESLLVEMLEDILYTNTIGVKYFENIDEYRTHLTININLKNYKEFMNSKVFENTDFWTDDRVIDIERIYNTTVDILGDMAVAAREYFSQKDLKKDESV